MRKHLLLTSLALITFVFSALSQTYNEADKEGLRQILRQKGTAYERSGGSLIHLPNTAVFSLNGLIAADTLTWYDSEEWIGKINKGTWSAEVPKKIINLLWSSGVEGMEFDLSYFSELRSGDFSVPMPPP